MDKTFYTQLIHLCSGTFPIGAFSHSYGLEYLTGEEYIKNAGEFEIYLRDMLDLGFGRNDMAIVKFAYLTPEKYDSVDELCTALKPSRELRTASIKTGRAFTRVFDKMYPGVLPVKPEGINYPVAFALACVYLKIPLEAALEAYAAGNLISLIQAGIKLIPLSQNDGQIIMKNCYGLIQKCVETALETQEDDLFSFTPFNDIASMLHERQYSRMYMS